ncbi:MULTISPECIES: phosphotransferase [unclassified Micromonospora]|uniref:phosphotransferase n=1 Tax=unclassified Micromonospora TaxID=2617518 RepID=UPI00363F3E16
MTIRIGEELAARMPKIFWAVGRADSYARWLPLLVPHLPARIPVPLHVGEPGAGFPWRWTVVPWFAGHTPPRPGCDDVSLARDVAAFVRALHAVDPAGGPARPPGVTAEAHRPVSSLDLGQSPFRADTNCPSSEAGGCAGVLARLARKGRAGLC